MNENENYVDLRARDLRYGDTLTGSGFKVRAATLLPDGRMEVIGAYPLSEVTTRYWNPNTTLTVRRLTTAL